MLGALPMRDGMAAIKSGSLAGKDLAAPASKRGRACQAKVKSTVPSPTSTRRGGKKSPGHAGARELSCRGNTDQ
jgi:hypothetical protein